jgi:hypothetical protein
MVGEGRNLQGFSVCVSTAAWTLASNASGKICGKKANQYPVTDNAHARQQQQQTKVRSHMA